MTVFAENFTIKVERQLKEVILCDTHSAANLPPLTILKTSIFFGKTIYFFLKKQISHVSRNLTISGAFYGKFSLIW